MVLLFFFGYESLSKGYNVLNEFMFQSHMRFCRMQWLPTRFYGSLSVYSRPLPSEKIAPFAAQLKIAFRRFLFYFGGEWEVNKVHFNISYWYFVFVPILCGLSWLEFVKIIW